MTAGERALSDMVSNAVAAKWSVTKCLDSVEATVDMYIRRYPHRTAVIRSAADKFIRTIRVEAAV